MPTYKDLERKIKKLERELTDCKQTEEALEAREKEYQLLIKNLPSIVFKGYSNGSAQFIDEKIKLLTGYDADKFNNCELLWSDLIVKKDFEIAKQIFVQALKTDQSYVREYRIKAKKGAVHWIQERGQIVCDNKGRIDYISGVFFDITELKLLQEETAKIEKKLHQAQKMAAIVTSAGGIVHDFNNILGAIIGHAELMALFDIPKDSPIRSRLDGMLKGAYRARDLVQQILPFSRQRR